ncbi:hypothetical protein ebA4026 [Aromatoleum aromaticum EbN1]|uniref:Uncharacterized protein n=1 Tax=Aromatoleum aromaticum (strain DSM 19018 / LMG 30748 / EbN1) TaxID=76114 RepID=Q5P2Q5_AROAE|nr:hypothetical protein ebA4026 [Aromatoleum aromaticum EbN1]
MARCVESHEGSRTKRTVFNRIEVPALARENREGGAIPPRAQRRDEDRPGRRQPLAKAGKAPGRVEPQSEDRPRDILAAAWTAAPDCSTQGDYP